MAWTCPAGTAVLGSLCPICLILPGLAGPAGGGVDPAVASPAATRERSASSESAPPRRPALLLIAPTSSVASNLLMRVLYSVRDPRFHARRGRFTNALRCASTRRRADTDR